MWNLTVKIKDTEELSGLGQPWRSGQIPPAPVLKVKFIGSSRVPLVRYCRRLLSRYKQPRGEVSTENQMFHKAQNVYSLALYRKSLLTPVLNYGVPHLPGCKKDPEELSQLNSHFLMYHHIEEEGEWILMAD